MEVYKSKKAYKILYVDSRFKHYIHNMADRQADMYVCIHSARYLDCAIELDFSYFALHLNTVC